MYLCQELAAVTSSQQVPDQVCTLLEFVKPNVCGNEIIELLKEATKIKEDDEERIEELEEGLTTFLWCHLLNLGVCLIKKCV